MLRRFERRAQAANVNIDRTLLDKDVVTPDLIEQLPEVLKLAREAYYVCLEGPDLPWVRGVEIRVRSVNDVAVNEATS